MKIRFVTAIYSNLYGTKFGGRPSRFDHYRWSLLSLLKMTNANFVCYCDPSELENLKDFFYNQHKIDQTFLEIIPFDLEDHYFKTLFDQYKNYEQTKHGSDRCIEIQYMKLIWVSQQKDYDYCFWIDAGLSHSRLIPNKYLATSGVHNSQYYTSSLFNNNFLKNLINFSNDSFVVIGKENSRNYWSGTVNPTHFKTYNSSRHIIGGLFGGKKELWDFVIEQFIESVYIVTKNDGRLYHEEDILTLIFRNYEEKFKMLEFDTWWHENERISGLDIVEHLKHNKSFYKILEELNV